MNRTLKYSLWFSRNPVTSRHSFKSVVTKVTTGNVWQLSANEAKFAKVRDYLSCSSNSLTVSQAAKSEELLAMGTIWHVLLIFFRRNWVVMRCVIFLLDGEPSCFILCQLFGNDVKVV